MGEPDGSFFQSTSASTSKRIVYPHAHVKDASNRCGAHKKSRRSTLETQKKEKTPSKGFKTEKKVGFTPSVAVDWRIFIFVVFFTKLQNSYALHPRL